MRDRTGKSARIAEKIRKKIGIDIDVKPETVTEENLAPSTKENVTEIKKDVSELDQPKKEEILKKEIKKNAPEAENKTENNIENIQEKK